MSQIAPIFAKHCLDCHGKEAKGGLRLDTFAGMEKGGKSGPLLVIGEAGNSLLMARLTAAGDARMPKGGEPLSEMECLKIAEWINKGAKFDGDDPNKPLAKLAAATDVPRPKNPVKIVVARPTGNETVSFVKDIAPFMVERCLRCHSGNDPKGGLSLETFESLLAGGKTGAEIVPGDLDKSRLWALVGNQKPFKMPPGDAYIKRTHWNHLRTWILEGAKFDGSDSKQPLRKLVPTDAERRTAELAHTSPQELHESAASERRKSGGGPCPRKPRKPSTATHSSFRETCRPSGSSRWPGGRPRTCRRLRRSSTTVRLPSSRGDWRSS